MLVLTYRVGVAQASLKDKTKVGWDVVLLHMTGYPSIYIYIYDF